MAQVEDTPPERAEAYTVCAACHLPAGQGIPGAFPPIRNRAREIAGLDGGREYLIGSVTFGLMGQISAGGQSYFGVMAGQRGAMDSQTIASALNYVVLDLVDDAEATPAEPFTSAEVDGVKEQWGAAGPNKAATLRAELVKTHGDDWPE
ncbi:MAG: cytochrome c [Lysobacterales bacterium]